LIPPLSLTTRIARAKKHGGGVGGNMQILRDTGVMMNSINSQLVSGGVSVGVGDVFGKAAMHQFGGTTTGGRWAGRKIPARPFMPIRGNRVYLPNDWQEDILAIIARNIQNATS
jgi:phage gpG-like protein